MSPMDSRVTLARPDLAAAELEGVVAAAAFAPTRRMAVSAPVAPLWREPNVASERMDELVLGETFDVLEEAGAFVWGQARRDGYVGYVAANRLWSPGPPPTHRVAAISTYAFAEPSIKTAASGPYSLGALVAIEADEGKFARSAAGSAGGAYFWAEHLAPIGGGFDTDWAAVAKRFIGAPYLWGGRTSVGLDCSGLVQQALYACGRSCPRDADQQAALGREIGRDELARGDLVCWRGHIGLMLDEMRLLHANAHHMATAIEPVADAIARIAAGPTGEPTAYRRL